MTEATAFIEEWSWFNFNNFRLAQGIPLKFSTSVAKGSKLKVKTILEQIPMFVEATKTDWRDLFAPSAPFFLNRVNINTILMLIF